ncbi:MAG: arsenate reductase ArsC [Fimbriimonadaceae bacterium]
MKKRVLFVCVENSNRSQMAEGFARELGSGVVEAYSAGSRPSGQINAMAVRAMAEKGIDISVQQSKGLSDLPQAEWEWVVTMGCGDACPYLPAKNRDDWALTDPKALPYDEFCKVRDEIERRVAALIEDCRASVNLE